MRIDWPEYDAELVGELLIEAPCFEGIIVEAELVGELFFQALTTEVSL